MKSIRSVLLVSVIAASTMLAGCSKLGLDSTTMDTLANAAAVAAVPYKVNDTFTVTKVEKVGAAVAVNVDMSKKSIGNVDKYMSSELQGKLADSAICSLPEFKTGSTSIMLSVYQNGQRIKAITTNTKYLCG